MDVPPIIPHTAFRFSSERDGSPLSLQPASMIGPLIHQLGHLSLSTTSKYMPTAVTMQGAYISQYIPVPFFHISVEENSSQPNQVTMDAASDHGDLFLLVQQVTVAPLPSLLNTNEFLEMLMLPDSRGLTRNTDHPWALLIPNTWPSFCTGLRKKSLHSCPLLFLHSCWSLREPGTWYFLCVLQRNQKNLFFFLLQIVLCVVVCFLK